MSAIPMLAARGIKIVPTPAQELQSVQKAPQIQVLLYYMLTVKKITEMEETYWNNSMHLSQTCLLLSGN